MPSSRPEVEVAVVGGGTAGSALAAVLAARGLSVALIDLHDRVPPDFRAEKLTAGQMERLRRLGLAPSVLATATPIDRLRIARFGRIVEERANREWGIDYPDLVGALRAQVPASARITARVKGIEAGESGARIVLAEGRTLEARVAVLATGLGKGLHTGLGIERAVTARDHSLAIGFDLLLPPGATLPTALTFHGERPEDRAAYLTLFPIGGRLRGNLFTYHRRDDPWLAHLRTDPLAALHALMPGLAVLLPPLAGITPPVVRPIHLQASLNPIRPGVVLIGDAFSTTCPTGGTGLGKALNDVEHLAALLPGWLASPGLGREKVAAFYADPGKRAGDAEAETMIRHARALALDRRLGWVLRRHRNYHAQRLRAWVSRHLAAGILPEATVRN